MEKRGMLQGSIWKSMTFFALPIFFGNLFQQLYNTVDSLIVGNFVGMNALAAVSSSGSITFLLIGFFNGVAIGAGVVISRYFGAKDYENMSKAIHTTIAFGLIISIIFTIIGVFLSPYILKLMDTPESVMPNSVAYLQIYFFGAIGLIMYNVFVGIMQAVGDSKTPLYYLIISAILNVLLDLLFIVVFKMGVSGAGLATIISQLVSAILCFIRLSRTEGFHRVEFRKIRIDLHILKQIISYGLPSGLQNSIIALANIVVQAKVNFFGEAAMAGIGAYSKIEGFGFLPITSFTMAITTFVGQNVGAKEFDRCKKGIRFGVITTMVLAEIIGIVIYILAPQLISAFDSTPEVVRYGVEKARISGPFFFLLAFSHALSAVLRGLGKSLIPMLVMLLCWCVIRVAFLVIMVPIFQDIWVVNWVYPITWGLSSLCFAIYYTFNHNYKKLCTSL